MSETMIMRRVRYTLGIAMAMLGAGAFGAPSARASAQQPARFVTVTAPFPASLPPAPTSPPARSADPFAAPSVLAPAFTVSAVSFDPSAAPPGAGDGLYVDWVSPLQAPRGASAIDFPAPGDAFADAGAIPAFSAAEDGRAPLSIPEASTLGLIGTALLPMLGLLLRRRT